MCIKLHKVYLTEVGVTLLFIYRNIMHCARRLVWFPNQQDPQYNKTSIAIVLTTFYSLIPRPSHRPPVLIGIVCKFGGRRPGIVWFPDPSCMGRTRKEREGRVW